MFPAKGLMFWTNQGGVTALERAAMDGTNRLALVSRSPLNQPIGLAVDYEEEKVVWVAEGKMWRMDLDGGKF